MKVRLYIRVRLTDGNCQFVDPVYAVNGKLKPFCSVVNGNAGHCPGGVCYLRYLMHGKRAWENVGTDAPSAMTARLKRERILAAPAAAVEVLEEEVENPPRTTSKSPWQNGIAKRFVGSCRRDLLHHSIVLNERRLKRLMAEYVRYYHEDRTHLGLDKRTPAGRKAATGTTVRTKVISMPRLRGLHHRYDLAA